MKTAKNPQNPDENKVDDKAKTKTETNKVNSDKKKDGDGQKTATTTSTTTVTTTATKTVTVALTKLKGSEKPAVQDGLKKWPTKPALVDPKSDEDSSVCDPFERNAKLIRSPPKLQTPARDERSVSCDIVRESVARETDRLRAGSERPMIGDRDSRASTCSETGEDEVFGRDGVTTREESAAAAMHLVRLKLDGILGDPNAKFSKPVAQKVAALFSKASKLIMQLGCDNAYLRGRLAERVETKRPPPATFAEVASKQKEPRREDARASVAPGTGEPKPFNGNRELTVIVADSTEKTRSVEEIKKTLLEMMDPVANKIRIRNVRKARDGKVIIQAHSKADAYKIVASTAIKDKGLTAALPAARKPRIILYDVPRDMEVDGVRRAIARQNPELMAGMSEEGFKEECVFRFQLGKGGEDTLNWVLEVAPGMRDKFRKAQRVYVGWRSCRVAEFTSLTRCFKCLGLGHIARHCGATEEVCSHCGLRGHRRDKCPNAAGSMTCVVCKRQGRPADHAVSDRGCPSYELARRRHAGTIDNG